MRGTSEKGTRLWLAVRIMTRNGVSRAPATRGREQSETVLKLVYRLCIPHYQACLNFNIVKTKKQFHVYLKSIKFNIRHIQSYYTWIIFCIYCFVSYIFRWLCFIHKTYFIMGKLSSVVFLVAVVKPAEVPNQAVFQMSSGTCVEILLVLKLDWTNMQTLEKTHLRK